MAHQANRPNFRYGKRVDLLQWCVVVVVVVDDDGGGSCYADTQRYTQTDIS